MRQHEIKRSGQQWNVYTYSFWDGIGMGHDRIRDMFLESTADEEYSKALRDEPDLEWKLGR